MRNGPSHNTPRQSPITSLVILTVISTLLFRWFGFYLDEGKPIVWYPFSQQVLQEKLAQRQIVLVNFGARWCNGYMNQQTFQSPRVRRAVEAERIVPLEADWTDGDPVITAQLKSHGIDTIPATIVYRAGCEPIILRDVISAEELVSALREAGRRRYCQ